MSRLDVHRPETAPGKVQPETCMATGALCVIEPKPASVAWRSRVGRAHQPLRRAVYDEIQRRIVEGRLQQGERIFEDQLAHELDVSRNPVREALQALESEGFVELEPRRGARVAVISAERANELFELREALEGMVARLAAQRRTPDQLLGLQRLVQLGADAAARRRSRGVARAEHRVPPTALRLRRTTRCLPTVSSGCRNSSSGCTRSGSRNAAASRGPSISRIVDAIADGDPARAFSEACEHISNARHAYISDQLATGDSEG